MLIDPRSNQVIRRVEVGNRPSGVAVARGDVLVSLRQSGQGHRGGTLTVRTNRPTDSIDTGVAYDSTSYSILRMTSDGLVAFKLASGLAGTQLVPDLAISLPTPTDGGKTYTFRLRDNIRYSTGRPVKASDFRTTLERDSSSVCRCPTTAGSSERTAASEKPKRSQSAATCTGGS